jgi:DNA-binding winged helix-turn-helix (wHTH) protein
MPGRGSGNDGAVGLRITRLQILALRPSSATGEAAVLSQRSRERRLKCCNYWKDLEDIVYQAHTGSTIRTGRLVVHLATRVVSIDDRPVHLTGKEYAILELLSRCKGTTMTKEMFLNHLYGGMDEPEIKIIDVFVCKLRKKLAQASGGDHYIETVWGRGYVLRDPAATAGTPKARAEPDAAGNTRFQRSRQPALSPHGSGARTERED